MNRKLAAALALGLTWLSSSAHAKEPPLAPADRWADETEAKMTDAERLAMIHGVMALPILGFNISKMPPDAVLGAGYIPGVPRLGVPSLRETDASLGVTNPMGVRLNDTSTAFPSSLALAASFDPDLARKVGEALGADARARGFNVLLGPGLNLTRDPRNGRNFEYLSEDPWLSGVMAGAEAAGIQSQRVIATLKHFAINSLETNRQAANAAIGEAAQRESDLLAFEIALEKGAAGSVMCSYNKVGGAYACGNADLLNRILKGAWGFEGWVMSDWGAVHGWSDALNGLDQESGEQLDAQVYFNAPLKAALTSGEFPRARLSDMVRRILRSMHVAGLPDAGPAPAKDPAPGDAAALEVARRGLVLLKNDGVLPLASTARTIAVIGGRASTGVLSGAGSGQGLPPGGWVASIPVGGEGMMGALRIERWYAGAPQAELARLLPKAQVVFESGAYPEDAEALARRADVAIVFAVRHESEGFDSPSLALPWGQDELIARVAKANPHTIVVLETGNPVAMPWLNDVKAVLAAWYPGQKGGRAIAEVLTGAVNPSGRLPMTFPKRLADTPRPELPGFGTPADTPTEIAYPEGSDAGYRWYAAKGIAPLFAFGHGLSYTSFAYSDLKLIGGATVHASFAIANTGARDGSDTAQLYLESVDGRRKQRLLGFQRVTLKPGETAHVEINVDPRLLADYDVKAGCWRLAGGSYAVAVAKDSASVEVAGATTLKARTFGR